MTDLPTAAALTDPTKTKDQLVPVFQAQREFIAQLPGAQADAELTIAAGVITPTRFLHRVDTQGDSAADDLDNILSTNLPDGSRLKLRAENAARVVTLRHQRGGAGELVLTNGEDFALNDSNRWIVLERRSTQWIEVLRSSVFGRRVGAAADAASVRTLLGLGTAALAATGTSGAVVPLLSGTNTFSAEQSFSMSDNGAGEGPITHWDRISITPAANDLLGGHRFNGRNSTGGAVAYAKMLAQILVATAGAEAAQFDWLTMVAGALASKMKLYRGLTLGGATGGDLGTGWVNAKGFAIDGVSLARPSFALLRDERSDGTDAGAGSTSWSTRPLQTEAYDPDGIVSLSSNQLTLTNSGRHVLAAAVTLGDGGGRTRLYDVTGAAAIGSGLSMRAWSGSGNVVDLLLGVVSPAGTNNVYRVEDILASAGASQRRGAHDNIAAGNECYLNMLVMKI